MSADYYESLFRCVDSKTLKIVDAEGARLFAALKAGVDLAKPNLDELQNTLGREIVDKEDMLAGCREIIDRGAKTVLLSLGKDGAVMTDGAHHYYCKSINVAVNSTVGAGDAMVAGLGQISFTQEKYREILSNLRVTEFF